MMLYYLPALILVLGFTALVAYKLGYAHGHGAGWHRGWDDGWDARDREIVLDKGSQKGDWGWSDSWDEE